MKEGSEDCDDGNVDPTDTFHTTNNQDNDGACVIDPGVLQCVNNTCGDGYLDAATEDCDDGNSTDSYLNGTANDDGACVIDANSSGVQCKNSRCGDGYWNAATEFCDDGDGVNGTPGNCNAFCTAIESSSDCGNGTTEPPEETCDDGNTTSGDGCSSSCQQETDAWWQIIGGNVYSQGSMISAVPSTTSLILNQLDTSGATVADSSGIPQTASGEIINDLSSSLPDVTRLSERSSAAQPYSRYNTAADGRQGFNYFLTQLGVSFSNPSGTPISAKPSEAPTNGIAYMIDGNLTIDPTSASDWAFTSSESAVFFINGDLIIANSSNGVDEIISVENGGFAAFIVSGDITIRSNVGFEDPEVFMYRPDLIRNFPEILDESKYQWREVPYDANL